MSDRQVDTDGLSVSVRGLDYAFGKAAASKPVLFDVDLDVECGEMVILTGPSGAGKTTLLSLIGTLRRVQGGSITTLGTTLGTGLAGLPMRQLNAVRREIGFIFQGHNLFEALTARQTLNVAMRLFPERYSRQDAAVRPRECLAVLDMAQHLDAKPDELSTGQKQRIAIARALINQPRLVLADEPTASLDAGTGDGVIDLLKRATREDGAAVIMVTHDTRLFAAADRVIQMVDGRIVG